MPLAVDGGLLPQVATQKGGTLELKGVLNVNEHVAGGAVVKLMRPRVSLLLGSIVPPTQVVVLKLGLTLVSSSPVLPI